MENLVDRSARMSPQLGIAALGLVLGSGAVGGATLVTGWAIGKWLPGMLQSAPIAPSIPETSWSWDWELQYQNEEAWKTYRIQKLRYDETRRILANETKQQVYKNLRATARLGVQALAGGLLATSLYPQSGLDRSISTLYKMADSPAKAAKAMAKAVAYTLPATAPLAYVVDPEGFTSYWKSTWREIKRDVEAIADDPSEIFDPEETVNWWKQRWEDLKEWLGLEEEDPNAWMTGADGKITCPSFTFESIGCQRHSNHTAAAFGLQLVLCTLDQCNALFPGTGQAHYGHAWYLYGTAPAALATAYSCYIKRTGSIGFVPANAYWHYHATIDGVSYDGYSAGPGETVEFGYLWI